jgi:DNA mismatch repair protein MSH5
MHFIARGADCPKVLSTTHFHELFYDNILSTAMPIHFLHMEIIVTSSSGEILDVAGNTFDSDRGTTGNVAVKPGESITYLYK